MSERSWNLQIFPISEKTKESMPDVNQDGCNTELVGLLKRATLVLMAKCSTCENRVSTILQDLDSIKLKFSLLGWGGSIVGEDLLEHVQCPICLKRKGFVSTKDGVVRVNDDSTLEN